MEGILSPIKINHQKCKPLHEFFLKFFLLRFVIILPEQELRLLRCKQNQTHYRSVSRSRGAQRPAKPGQLLPANSTGHASVFCGIVYEVFRRTRTAQ